MYAAYCRIFDRARARLSGRRGRERADRRRRQPRVHGPGRKRRRSHRPLPQVRLCRQPGAGRNRRQPVPDAAASRRREPQTADQARHAPGRQHRAGEQAAQVQAAPDDQDADLPGRRTAGGRPGPRRPRSQRRQDPPRAEGQPSSNWPRPRSSAGHQGAGRFCRAGRSVDSRLGRLRRGRACATPSPAPTRPTSITSA